MLHALCSCRGELAATGVLRSVGTPFTTTLVPGFWVIIIGTNGSGKSTLLNAVAGTFFVDHGTIRLAGQDVTRWPEHARASLLGRVLYRCRGS
jgi:ABC-type uncharacterized transport system ATPase component